jgi:hypothetical protein
MLPKLLDVLPRCQMSLRRHTYGIARGIGARGAERESDEKQTRFREAAGVLEREADERERQQRERDRS